MVTLRQTVRRCGLLAVLTAAPVVAGATTPDADARLCEAAVAAEAERGRVPGDVLHAISLTETGRPAGGTLRPWPWAVNREGQGFWFPDREAALAFAKASLAAGRRSFDVGCFQINYHWHGEGFASLEAMFDPGTGADYAAGFLRSLYDEAGDWSLAAGAYHSRSPDLATRYRTRFDRIRAGLPASDLMLAEPAAPRKSRTRLARRPLIITVRPAPERPEVEASVGAVRVSAGIQGSSRSMR